MTRQSTSDAGFTLIEMLVGITLLAMLAVLIATGTQAGGRAWNSAERQTAEMNDIEAVQGLLRRTIAQARPAFTTADPADMTIAFEGEPDTLRLVSTLPGTWDNGPWMHERFFVARSGKTRALFMSWQGAWAATSNPRADLVGEAMLLDRVAAIRFAYFGPPRSGETPVWVDQWIDRDRLPQLVRVEIQREGNNLAAWPELVVATRVTGNAGCIYDALRSTCQRMR